MTPPAKEHISRDTPVTSVNYRALISDSVQRATYQDFLAGRLVTGKGN
jgi:hypothetical protein